MQFIRNAARVCAQPRFRKVVAATFALGGGTAVVAACEGGSWFSWGSKPAAPKVDPTKPPRFHFLEELPIIDKGVKAYAPEVRSRLRCHFESAITLFFFIYFLSAFRANHQVPPPSGRREPAHVIVDINTTVKESNMTRGGSKFPFWTFDDQVPGPIIRCRVGDHLEIR